MIVKIDGIQISDFTVNDITFNYDAVSDTFSLTTPYQEWWEKDRKMFKPLKYPVVEIFDNNKRKLLTGLLINSSFKCSANASELSVSGYSITGVLDDCPDVSNSIINENPSTCYTGMTLRQFTESLVKPFGIEVLVDELVKDRMDEVYEQVTTEEGSSIASQLAKLATLKNVVMRATADGRLRFTQINTKLKPVAKFSTGDGVVNEISLQVNGQSMHSVINVIGAMDIIENPDEDMEKSGNAQSISNPLVKMFRPAMVKQGTENNALKEVTKAALADELKNISITIDCRGWKIIDDNILLPGDLITVKAPGVYLYNWTTLLVRSVKLKEDSNSKSSSIICVLPQTMTGEVPELIFD